MKKIKKTLLIVLCAVLSLFTIACGGSGDDNSSNSGSNNFSSDTGSSDTGSSDTDSESDSSDTDTDTESDTDTDTGGGDEEDTYYTVTFVQNGQESVVIDIKEGEGLSADDIPAPKSKEGYTVTWEEKDLSEITDNVVVNAIERANTYVVTYNANGGAVTNATQDVTFDASYTLETPVLSGQIFKGWYNGDAPVELTGTWKIASDVTLTASWEVSPGYTAIIKDLSGETVKEIRVDEGEDFPVDQLPSLPTLEGYTVSWDHDFNNIAEDITISMVKTPNTYTVTFDANGGTVASATQEVTFDASYTLATPEKSGYIFKGWYNGDTYVELTGTWTSASGANLTAKWEEDITSNGGYTDRW